MGPNVFFYKWEEGAFKFVQRLFTGDRPYDMAAFDAGQEEFFCVATMPRAAHATSKISKLLMVKWTGNQFESFQNITAYGVRYVKFMKLVNN